jgi:DNA (cytosine-5)-methyltransferase 1
VKPRCADLFCGAGGAATGLSRAGFEVEGWDIVPQKNYPFQFHWGNALEAVLEGFDFVWASPPCQAHSALKTMPNAKNHLDLIPATRDKLEAWGGPWIIENVIGAPLRNPVMLCGTMFGLGTSNGQAELRRHRIFESPVNLMTMDCRHNAQMLCGVYGGHGRDRRRTVGVWGHAGGSSVRDGVQQFSTEQRREAMGIDWMSGAELSQAIPPAYSEFLGRQIMRVLDKLKAEQLPP